jgi:hypothetical protein
MPGVAAVPIGSKKKKKSMHHGMKTYWGDEV